MANHDFLKLVALLQFHVLLLKKLIQNHLKTLKEFMPFIWQFFKTFRFGSAYFQFQNFKHSQGHSFFLKNIKLAASLYLKLKATWMSSYFNHKLSLNEFQIMGAKMTYEVLLMKCLWVQVFYSKAFYTNLPIEGIATLQVLIKVLILTPQLPLNFLKISVTIFSSGYLLIV